MDIRLNPFVCFCPRLSDIEKTEIHLISLPFNARGVGVCLRWSQQPAPELPEPEPDTDTSTTQMTETTEALPDSTTTTESVTEELSSELSSSTFPQTLAPTTEPQVADEPKRKKKKGRQGKHRNRTTTTPATTAATTLPPNFGDIIANDQPYQYGWRRRGGYGRYKRQVDASFIGDGSYDYTFEGCWALDNIAVVNMANLPSAIEEQFDPIDPSQWLFFPGAHVQVIWQTSCACILMCL